MYKDLANTKAYYERSLEQISVLENNKQLAVQQQELAEQEKVRLRAEVDRLRDVSESTVKTVLFHYLTLIPPLFFILKISLLFTSVFYVCCIYSSAFQTKNFHGSKPYEPSPISRHAMIYR